MMATERERDAYLGRGGATSSPRVHSLCQKRLGHATSKSESSLTAKELTVPVHCRQLRSVHAGGDEEGWLVRPWLMLVHGTVCVILQ